ncbi:DUF3307 domain-containing protein [Parafrankia discariae]|uniref:DUF3307 domain-containing protein n=1 Tax=Parafrankia discariae TaxID=365528 RepID=UPI0003A8E253|nr:DUF3307 domain-containing protein [Parafrankia discariae]
MTDAMVFCAAFIALYTGHHLGDHVAQTDWQAREKGGRGWPAARAMAAHLFAYHLCVGAALASLLIVDVPLRLPGVTAALSWSIVTHAFIDRRWPVRWLLRRSGAPRFAELNSGGINGVYLADQSLHLGCLFVGALLAAGLS